MIPRFLKNSAAYLQATDSRLILALESSCDDTSAAVLRGNKVLSNVAASQVVHEKYGGVVPELASREHQRQIVPVTRAALEISGVNLNDVQAIAYTRGPGLLGSLLVGSAFAKSLAISKDIPLIEVHHMHAHILAHFIDDQSNIGGIPSLPFLCLTVSGGHTQIVQVNTPTDMQVLGQTIDDAAGEAFDKIGKIMGLPYPGGPSIDRLARLGDPNKFDFPKPKAGGLDFSFSGLKTAVLYFLKKEIAKDSAFIEKNKNDLAASIQKTIVDLLIVNLEKAVKKTGITSVALAGGVSANSQLRSAIQDLGQKHHLKVHIPAFEYCTDNAAMIGMAGQLKWADGVVGGLGAAPSARLIF